LGFVTSLKGRVLADLVVLAGEDRFWIELPVGRGEAVREHVLKYRIADRVEVEAFSGTVLTLAGPQAAAALRVVGAGVEEGEVGWSHAEVEIGGVSVRRVRRGIGPGPAFDLWVEGESTDDDVATLRRVLGEAGAAGVDLEAWETLRVERGVPRFGAEFSEENFPQETGLPAATVNYDKGCYLGQEVVARIHYRGGVNKGLLGLDLGTAEPPFHGTPVLHDGREAGRIGSAVASPALGRTVGLAILHQRAGEPGTEVQVEGTGAATVVELPFAAG
jgi:folate-binding protein YgfZ